jgi:uncharacterized protein YkwD
MKKSTFFSLLIFILCASFIKKQGISPVSPLAAYSTEWNNPKYSKYNSAKDVAWLTGPEKEVIYILNLLRANPALFANTVVKQYPVKSGQGYLVNSWYYTSLLDTLKKMRPAGLLKPDITCFNSAKCHALYSGATGYVGHDRTTEECKSKKFFNGECCDYGHDKPLDIVMSLLIDEGVPSLGHRDVCLSAYKKIGVSIQAHQRYGYNAVLDFSY